MACLVNGGKGKNFVEILRYFGVNDARNRIDRAILDLNMKSHSVSQVKTKYLAVSMDIHIELFRISETTSIAKIQQVKTDAMFNFLLRVFPNTFKFENEEQFLQESFVGFNNGSLIKCSVVAELAPKPCLDDEMDEGAS